MFTSLMDWLDPQAPIEWLADFLRVIHECRNLDWLLLTKRPELWPERIDAVAKLLACDGSYRETPGAEAYHDLICPWRAGEAPGHVWFGVTVENQEMADKRIPELLKIPARIRWLSVEPLLKRINIRGAFDGPQAFPLGRGIGWVVVGGESGRNRRDCGVEAINGVVAQCTFAQVPIFVKQDCAAKPGQQGRIPDEIWKLKQYPKMSNYQREKGKRGEP